MKATFANVAYATASAGVIMFQEAAIAFTFASMALNAIAASAKVVVKYLLSARGSSFIVAFAGFVFVAVSVNY